MSRPKYKYYHSSNIEYVMLVIPSDEPHDPSCPEAKQAVGLCLPAIRPDVILVLCCTFNTLCLRSLCIRPDFSVFSLNALLKEIHPCNLIETILFFTDRFLITGSTTNQRWPPIG